MENGNRRIIRVGETALDLTAPVVMTILNVTPDSFWEGSRRRSVEDIRRAVGEAAGGGASIIDVGGYSSRPGAGDVSATEEYDRVARAMEIIRGMCPGMAVSVDTFRAGVAERIVRAFGACIINDISAGELDPLMIPVVAELGVPYIAMHMRGTPADMQDRTEYEDIVGSVKSYFAVKLEQLRDGGIKDIIIDPGFGFAKTTAQNYRLMRRMDELLGFGCPMLSGISRKSMIYKVLGTTPAEALAATSALNWESLCRGASILRVHDTREAADIIKIYNYYTESNG